MSGHCKIWLWAAHSFPRQPKVCGTTTWKAKEQELWICCGCETFSKIRSLPDKCIHSILEDNQWAHIAMCPCTHCTRAYTLVNTQLSVHSNYTQTVCKYVCIYIHVHLHFIYNEIIYDNNMLSWNLIVAPSSLLPLNAWITGHPNLDPPIGFHPSDAAFFSLLQDCRIWVETVAGGCSPKNMAAMGGKQRMSLMSLGH